MSDGYIANTENNITFTYEDDGTQVCDPNLCVIAFGYRKNGELKWIDVRNLTTGETKRYMANIVEDIVYIWWNGNYVWTDINCHRLEVGGDSWEEFKDYVLEQAAVSLPISSSDTIEDTDYTIKTEEDSNNNLVAKRITFANVWNWIKQKVSSFFGLTVTESGGSVTNRSFDGNASKVDIEVASSGNNYIVASSTGTEQINGETPLKTSLQFNETTKALTSGTTTFATLEDVNSITAKYITSSAAGAAFADEAALAGDKYYAGQIITTSTSPALGNNDYCIVLDSGSSHNNATARYVYQSGVWVFQYVISQVILSQTQLDALNSGITNSKVSAYDGYATNKLSVSENLHDLNDASTAIENLCDDSSSVDTVNAIKDTTKIPVSYTSASIPNRSGHTTLLDIFNNWLKDKLQSWLGITVNESGGSITERSFSGEAATVASITRVIEGVHHVDTHTSVQTNVTYTVTFSIPTGKIFIGYRFNIEALSGSTLNIESSYKVTRNQIIVSVKYDFTYGGAYPTITTVAMFCGQ